MELDEREIDSGNWTCCEEIIKKSSSLEDVKAKDDQRRRVV
jgi:hypothetical protein